MRSNIILIVLLAACAVLLFFTKTKTEYVDVIKTDTVYVEKVDTLWQTEYLQGETVYRPEYDTVYLTGDTDTVFVYQDTVKLDSVEITYIAEVEGKIRNITFGVVNKYPVVTKTVTKTITNTEIRYPDALYAGVFLTPNTVGVSLTKTMNRHSFSLGYGLNQTMYLGYSYRIK